MSKLTIASTESSDREDKDVIIPLGFGKKTHKLPVVILMIVVATVAAYFVQPNLDKYTIFSAKSSFANNVKHRKSKLFLDYCRNLNHSQKTCKTYLPVVASQHFEISPQQKIQKLDIESKQLHKQKQEMKEAISLVAKLKKRKISPDEKRIRNTLVSFWRTLNYSPNYLQNFPSWKPYATALHHHHKQSYRYQKRAGLLTRMNASVASVFSAQFQHAGWYHLIGNMMFLIVFGIYVEQRTGWLLTLIAYFSGGMLSLYTYIIFSNDPTIPLLGASGNVSVIMGMFFALFYNRKMSFFLPRGNGKGFAKSSVLWAIPLFFITGDFVGLIGDQGYLYGQSQVAHMVHLTGFALGIGLGALINKMNPLSSFFVSRSEERLIQRLIQVRSSTDVLRHTDLQLRINPRNFHLLHLTIYKIFARINEDPKNLPTKSELRFLRKYLPRFCRFGMNSDHTFEVLQTLGQTPNTVPLEKFLKRISPKKMLLLAEIMLFYDHPAMAIRILDAYLMKYPTSRQIIAVARSIEEITDSLGKDPRWHAYLGQMASLYPDHTSSRVCQHFLTQQIGA